MEKEPLFDDPFYEIYNFKLVVVVGTNATCLKMSDRGPRNTSPQRSSGTPVVIRNFEHHTEARKLIPPQISHPYAQATKSSKLSAATQTDENITTKCPPLNLLQPLRKPNVSPTTPVTTSSSSTQAHLLQSNFSIAVTMSDPQPPIPVSSAELSTSNNMFTPVGSSSSVMSASSSGSGIQPPPSKSSKIPDLKKCKNSCKEKKELLKK
ncbi:hypothetical protein TNCV_4539101 [Trichonephila clavipes]|nr:hypothetical protein TNCV_4539101 [Trichonephila clavipes]